MKKTILTFAIILSISILFSDIHANDNNYFLSKWSKEQQKIVYTISGDWLSSSTNIDSNENIIELIRLEGLLAALSTNNNIKLYLPKIKDSKPEKIAPQLITILCKEHQIQFSSEAFFEYKKFHVNSYKAIIIGGANVNKSKEITNLNIEGNDGESGE